MANGFCYAECILVSNMITACFLLLKLRILAEVKNSWRCISTSPYTFVACIGLLSFTFLTRVVSIYVIFQAQLWQFHVCSLVLLSSILIVWSFPQFSRGGEYSPKLHNVPSVPILVTFLYQSYRVSDIIIVPWLHDCFEKYAWRYIFSTSSRICFLSFTLNRVCVLSVDIWGSYSSDFFEVHSHIMWCKGHFLEACCFHCML